MKKIIKLIKSDSTYLLVIIHVITRLAFIIFVSLKYDWIVEQFGSYMLFVVWVVPIAGFIVGGYYFVVDYFSLYFNKDKESEDDVNVWLVNTEFWKFWQFYIVSPCHRTSYRYLSYVCGSSLNFPWWYRNGG